jgi:type II secretory ATPase GspE/PulE/Tfp pilus assembly ATPase PilB-like protein
MADPSPEIGKVISIKVLDRLKQTLVNEGLVTKEKLRVAEITAQRLVRRICLRCKKEYQPDESFLKRLGLSLDTKLFKGDGYELCSGIGHRGRVGIFEIVVINESKLLFALDVTEKAVG